MEGKRSKTRIRRKNGGFKKILLLLLIAVAIIYMLVKVIVPGAVSLSRYVYKNVRNYYLTSKSFYFKADKLSTNTAHFESSNWSGDTAYSVTINMNSRKNISEVSSSKIYYDIYWEYAVYDKSGKEMDSKYIDFDLDGMQYLTAGETCVSRTIPAETNEDSFKFQIEINDALLISDGLSKEDIDHIYVKITAKSTAPYKATIDGEFSIGLGNLGMEYSIDDSTNSPYLNLVITNTVNSYMVLKTFTDSSGVNHPKDSTLTIEEYLALTDAQKANCHSMTINVTFDPNVVVIDTTASEYIYAKNNGKTTEEVLASGETYINSINFEIDAEESKVIKFYKLDSSKDYTLAENDSTIKVEGII